VFSCTLQNFAQILTRKANDVGIESLDAGEEQLAPQGCECAALQLVNDIITKQTISAKKILVREKHFLCDKTQQACGGWGRIL
jgi:hypothetical protein